MKNKLWLRAITITGGLALAALQTVSAQSNFQWAQSAAQGDDNQYTTSVAVDDAGNSYNAGFFNSSDVYFDNMANPPMYNSGLGEDGFLAKYNPDGVLIWAANIGGTGNDRCSSVSAFHNGNVPDQVYVSGTFNGTVTLNSNPSVTNPVSINLSSVNGGQDAYVAKYDAEGLLIWAYAIGGTGTDNAYSISANTNGSSGYVCYIAGKQGSGTGLGCHYGNGTSTISPSFTIGGDDGYLVKYTDNGSTATANWIKVMSSTGSDGYYCVSSNATRVSVGGQHRGVTTVEGAPSTITAGGSYDIIVASYLANGNFAWANTYGSTTGTSNENATSIAIDPSDNTYFGGFAASGVYSSGAGWEAFVKKTDATGATLFTSSGGSGGDDYVQTLTIDKCSQRVYVGGVYRGTLIWGATLSPFNTTADNDGFMLELNGSDLSYRANTANRLGGIGADIVYSIGINRLNREYVVGVSQAYNWQVGSATYFTTLGYSPLNTNYDSFLARWIDGTWPAGGTGNVAVHAGLSVDDCTEYAGGTLHGTYTFGSTTLSSTLNSLLNPTDDIYLSRADRFGNYNLFTKVVYGTAVENMLGQTMDNNDNLYLTGYATTGAAGSVITFNNSTSITPAVYGTSALLIKTNNVGLTQWHAIGRPNNISSSARATGSAVDASGNVYVCGYFTGSVLFGSTTINTAFAGQDIFLAKYDNNGALLWVRNAASGSAAGMLLKANGIALDNNNLIYITGTYNGQTNFNGSSSTYTLAYTLGTNLEIFAAQFDNNGYALKTLGYSGTTNSDEAFGIIAPSSNLVYITGYLDHVNKHAFTARAMFASSPIWYWTKIATGSASFGKAIIRVNNDIYITGLGYSGAAFGSHSLTTSGTIVVRYEYAFGTEMFVSVRPYAGDGVGIAADKVVVDNIFTASSMALIDQLSSDRGNFARYAALPSDNGNSISGNTAPAIKGSMYPNPSEGIMTLELDGLQEGNSPVTLTISDISGRTVLELNGITASKTNVDASSLANGTYYYQLTSNNERIETGKILIAH